MNENHRAKRIVTVTAIIIVVVCAVIVISNKLNNDRSRKNAAAYSQMIQPLEMELDALEKELAKLEAAESAKSFAVPTSESCFLSPNSVLREILPVFNTQSYPCGIVLSENRLPGCANSITLDEFRALLTQGWEFFWEYDGQDDLAAWYDRMRLALDALGLAAPKTVYCTKGNYSTALDDALLQMGFENVIHHGEEKVSTVSDLPEESGMWRIYSSNIMSTEHVYAIDTVLTAKGNLMREWDLDEIRSLSESGRIEIENINIEESISNAQDNSKDWTFGSVTQMRGLRLENHQRHLDSIENVNQPKTELKKQIQSLEEKIAALRGEIYGR